VVSLRQNSFFAGSLATVVVFVVAPHVFPNPLFRFAMGDIVPLLVELAAAGIMASNALQSRGHARLFWSLMSLGMLFWGMSQAGWVWFEVVVHQPVPDPFLGDIVLFLHQVPVMAAVSVHPQQSDEDESMLGSTVNVLILLSWWVIVYAFAVFPDEYIQHNGAISALRWDVLYMIAGLIVIGISGWSYFSSVGAWRRVYKGIFVASIIYAFASLAINLSIIRNTYVTGGIPDVILLASMLGFLWVAVTGQQSLRETQQIPVLAGKRGTRLVPHLAKLAMLSLPVMGYWALFVSDSPLYMRKARFGVTMGGLATLAFFVFLRQFLLDQKLVRLLKQARRSYDNLYRLERRVVQQAKLASLGEMVALAAGELEYPLSAILGSSEILATSSNLSKEQLSTARKIGQQAWRTRELVGDLLSFAQQSPGEKIPLDLKPLLQRAVQMEGFKLDNKSINLMVHSDEPAPRVLGNSNQLLQAFLQIVENAVDALQSKGGGNLLVSQRRDGDEVVIEFADDGPGLRDPERVFDPFYTTKPVGKGTGLGLSATYGVVQNHKGQITCYNRPEGGAMFEIRLPALKASGVAAGVVAG
jgi:signal transduction histidine kinase